MTVDDLDDGAAPPRRGYPRAVDAIQQASAAVAGIAEAIQEERELDDIREQLVRMARATMDLALIHNDRRDAALIAALRTWLTDRGDLR